MIDIVVIAHNIRSCHNVGSLLRTSEGLGVNHFYFTGYTPYPLHPNDIRMPHISAKITKQIQKTALGAEQTLPWSVDTLDSVIAKLKNNNYKIIGLEQNPSSIPLQTYQATNKIALLIGNEVSGLDDAILHQCDKILEIPMTGKKESFNVTIATAIALYHIRFNIV